ncbi:hypothetical protein [Halocatena halophila]|uniref:hypothetical protein n=1 Tax=Halocatena halophila TaxID=2814576 RepID=UPI002ED324E3
MGALREKRRGLGVFGHIVLAVFILLAIVIQAIWLVGKGSWCLLRFSFGGPRRRRISLAVIAGFAVLGWVVVTWSVTDALARLLDLIFGIPAPGQPLSPGSWMAPSNGVWPDLIALSRLCVGVGALCMLGLGARALAISDESLRRQELKKAGKAGVFVGATYTILPFVLHLTDQVAMALAPSPEQLLSALELTTTAGGVLAIAAKIQPLTVAVGALAAVILRGVILFGFVAWPLAWPLRTIDNRLADHLGRSITAVFTVAIVTKLLQSAFAFLLVFLLGALNSLVLRLVVFVIGVLLVFVVFPAMMLRYAERVLLLPIRFLPRQHRMQEFVEESSDRVGQVHKQVETGRERFDEWRAPPEPEQTSIHDWTLDGPNATPRRRWVQVIPRFHTSAAWKQGRDDEQTLSDGHGPTSETPDERQTAQKATDEREQQRLNNR